MSPTPKKRPIDLTQRTKINNTDVFIISSHAGEYNTTYSNLLKLTHQYAHNLTIGEIKSFAINDIPEGYLKMDGSKHTIADYPLLWDKINGVLDGVIDNGDGSFNLPNWDRYFLRYDTNPERTLGKPEKWAIENIKGEIGTGSNTGVFWTKDSKGAFSSNGIGGVSFSATIPNNKNRSYSAVFDASKVVKASNETRPMNVSVIYAIKCDLK